MCAEETGVSRSNLVTALKGSKRPWKCGMLRAVIKVPLKQTFKSLRREWSGQPKNDRDSLRAGERPTDTEAGRQTRRERDGDIKRGRQTDKKGRRQTQRHEKRQTDKKGRTQTQRHQKRQTDKKGRRQAQRHQKRQTKREGDRH